LNLVNKEIDMYNRMVEKEGTDGEEEAKRLFFEAKKEVERAAEMEDEGAGPSQALIKRVSPCRGMDFWRSERHCKKKFK
jgi:LETM1 and EF-hand domain-containing protein 1